MTVLLESQALVEPAAAPRPGRTTTSDRPRHLRVVVRPAPRREPPFDDEVTEPSIVGRHDRCLPFGTAAATRPRPRSYVCPRGLPDPASWARRLMIGLIESADGRRPLHQLSSLLSLSVGRGLRQDFEASSSRIAPWLRRATVRSVLTCRPADGVAELAVTVEAGDRVRAVAMRLEDRHGRWCCTRLQLG